MFRRHPILTLCSAASLLLCMTVFGAAAWGSWHSSPARVHVNSRQDRWPSPHVFGYDRVRLWAVAYYRGSLHVAREVRDIPPDERMPIGRYQWTSLLATNELGRLGVHRLPGGFDLACPVPLAIVVTGLLPVLWAREWQQWRSERRRPTFDVISQKEPAA